MKNWLAQKFSHFVNILTCDIPPDPLAAMSPKVPVQSAVVITTCHKQAPLAMNIAEKIQQSMELLLLLQ
jgi:hypothetical protein